MGPRQRLFTAPAGFAHSLQHHPPTGPSFYASTADDAGPPPSAGTGDAGSGGSAAWEAEWIDLGGEG